MTKVDDDLIKINVIDENKNKEQAFTIQRKLLFQEMKYFEAHASDSYQEDLDISVHCDIAIFEWLMRYVKEKLNPPELTVKNVVSILISSNYLKMESLEKWCIQFIADNLS